ncbi:MULTISPECIES: ABC-F family ATP-binding cassette domain-containing protein [Lentibacter]|jgi:ATP-binding cassette subfamily F protein 3|uniref:ATP-binding cassette, subfamily F, member 3 n=4 Tax=Lentibacter algarum TaxID=576131 RepID=A0A1H3KGI9_9RHOB|nr:ABC-F family ATP-binding cassette domain-containing protein [Lentibacter algarum]MCO4828415.1 ABC-F family ATP-binding cassette domain-containing protein [Lentibacter algarum]WIF31975.1 ATPase component of ABC transporter with duplicated ATPase domain protein [Lentibacter algarum]SDY50724.1 ATP-binding cassette, subfamily F, member 3 [Lentibacter algarum]
MLKLENISYSVAGRNLIEDASVSIPTGHKVGLVGRNGTGKTTLFRVIRGELPLDTGSFSLPSRARIGGVAQEVPGNEVSLLNTVLAADVERATLLADTSTDPARIAEVQTRLADIDAWSAEARASTILRGLGFTADEMHEPCSAFSGGWRMRVALAAVLFSEPDLLLLDEPTNYLDLEGALWLESYLAKYPHTVLIVSHDRGLLNRAVGAILHLEDKKLTLYQGNYDTFAETRAARIAVAASENRKIEARKAHLQSFVDRFRAKASKAVQAQSRIKAIAKLKPITTPQEAALKRFTFPSPEELSPPIIRVEGGAVGYDGKAILSNLDLRIDQDDRIALLGRNGEGKSTLSKLLSGRLELMKGQMVTSSKLRVGFFAQHQVDELFIDETPIDHIRRLRPTETPARLRARLGGFGIGAEQAETLVGKLSGGQKARLSLMLATIDAPHLLILDEPTNHLDIESREALVEALTAYTGAVILVSHDMHLLSLVADRLWLVKDGAVKPYEGDLESYRALLLGAPEKKSDKKTETQKAPKPKRAPRLSVLELRAEVRKCEERVEKLERMRARMDEMLADPTLYSERKHAVPELQRKDGELKVALKRAEALWEGAIAKLEAAEA